MDDNLQPTEQPNMAELVNAALAELQETQSDLAHQPPLSTDTEQQEVPQQDAPEELRMKPDSSTTPVVEPSLKELEDPACQLVQEILSRMDLETETIVKEHLDGQLFLEIQGPDLGVLIGKHGRTLNSLQYLVNVILSRRVRSRVRVILDAEGYRNRREKALLALAEQTAARVRERGKKVKLEDLRADERRIIHMALQNEKDIVTYSEGEEPYRRIVVAPAREQ